MDRRQLALRVLLLVGFAALLRFAVLAGVHPVKIVGDERTYLSTAVNIAEGRGHLSAGVARAGWPPGHSWLLSFFVAGDTRAESPSVPIALLCAEVLLGSLLVGLTWWLGRSLFDPVTGWVAGGICAVYPTFVAYSHYLWSETLFSVLLTSALLAVVSYRRNPTTGSALAAGLLFGMAALTREVALLIAGSVALWWLMAASPGSDRRKTLIHAAAMLSLAACVVAPWTARNYSLFGRFVPVSSVSWMSMREGNTFAGSSWLRPNGLALRAFRKNYYAHGGEMARSDFARREALELIRKEQPTWIFKKLARNSALLFGPDSFVFKKLSRDAYGEPSIGVVRGVLVATMASYLLVAVGAILGIASARGLAVLPCLVTGAMFTLHVIANASSRYRFPLMPLMIVYAGHAAVGWRTIPARLAGPRAVAAAAAIAILLGWCLPYFWADAASLWSSGRYVQYFRP